ncbi:MAG TPA: DJ-1/PfpI family protein [Candidatus Acidoferrum sp.]|nr:DJ-1/PfpI family protein [Candidatus Acidoferrum sp.]
MEKLNVGILLFDDVEVLDFAGPFEVFSRTRLTPGAESRRSEDSAPFHVFTVAKTKQSIQSVGNLIVEPHYSFSEAPRIDIVVIPGGWGSRKVMQDPEILGWTQRAEQTARYTSSVCTGALVLARAGGLLAGRRATTHWAAYDLLESLDDGVKVIRDVRVVQDGIFSSAGVSAGIDMAFALVEEICGHSVADETAH